MVRMFRLKNVKIVDTISGLVGAPLNVIIAGNNVKDICETCEPLADDVLEVECTGKYAIPGLFDCHTHLATLTYQPPDVEREIFDECQLDGSFEEGNLTQSVLPDFIQRGITQVRDLGGPIETLQRMKRDIEDEVMKGPDILFAGPMLEMPPLTGAQMNERWPGWMVAIDSVESAEEAVESLAENGVFCFKAFGRFENEVLESFVSHAANTDLPVTLDPGPTFFHDIDIYKGLDLGIQCFEHAKSLWRSVLKDDFKEKHDRLKSKRPEDQAAFAQQLMSVGSESISISKLNMLAEEMSSAHAILCPTLHISKLYSEKPEIFNDQEPEKFRPLFATLFEVGCVIVSHLAKRGIRMLVGQDGYIPRFTHQEMILLSENGLSSTEILKGATIYPAEWLGLTAMYGSIETGKKANLVILDDNPIADIRNTQKIRMVILDGRIAYQSSRFY